MSSLCNIHNIGNIWCQFGKEWNGNSGTHPAADVTHQHWVLIKDISNIWSHKPVFFPHQLKHIFIKLFKSNQMNSGTSCKN